VLDKPVAALVPMHVYENWKADEVMQEVVAAQQAVRNEA
jgi:hypothetical protein